MVTSKKKQLTDAFKYYIGAKAIMMKRKPTARELRNALNWLDKADKITKTYLGRSIYEIASERVQQIKVPTLKDMWSGVHMNEYKTPVKTVKQASLNAPKKRRAVTSSASAQKSNWLDMVFKKRKRTTRRRYPTRKRYKKKRALRSKSKFGMNQFKNWVKKRLNSGMATHIHYRYDSAQIYSPQLNYTEWTEIQTGGVGSSIEAAMANLRYFDPNTNSLVIRDASSGNYHRDISVKIQTIVTFKNSAMVPTIMHFYLLKPKVDTNITPLSALNSGLVDQDAASTISPYDSWVYPKHSAQFSDAWRIISHKRIKLYPGKVFTFPVSTRWFKYDASWFDLHPQVYQVGLQCRQLFVRTSSDLMHSNAAGGLGEVARGHHCVDYEVSTKTVFYYDAGKDLHDYSFADARTQEFTNSGLGVTGMYHIPDNVQLSRT